jgi:hypothetical protein
MLHGRFVFAGDNRGFDPSGLSPAFRGRQAVTVVTNTSNPGLLDGTELNQAGTSSAYVFNKGTGKYVFVTSEPASSRNMHISQLSAGGDHVKVRMEASVVTPLVPPAPPAHWDLTVDVYATNATSATYVIKGERSQWPALEVDINGSDVMQLPPEVKNFAGPYSAREVTRALYATQDFHRIVTRPIVGP